MANLRANSIVGVGSTDAGVVFDGVTKIKTQNYFYLQTGNTESRSAGISTEAGVIRFNSDSQKLEYYDGAQWLQVSTFSPLLNGGARGVMGGGLSDSPTPAVTAQIDYINISSTGNSTNFGNLTLGSGFYGCSFGSSTRGFFAGISPGAPGTNDIEYVNFSSTGNSIDYGDLTRNVSYEPGGCSNSTRGLVMGGNTSPGSVADDTIDALTMASNGTAFDFGNLANAGRYSCACASSTRGIYIQGATSSPQVKKNTIDFVTIATQGNSTKFGDLNHLALSAGAASNSIRGLIAGGDFSPTPTNIIDYITISTTGNATDFGDLTDQIYGLGGFSSPTRAVFFGGSDGTSYFNTIEYVNITTMGNSVDFGDRGLTGYNYVSACSNAHGGL